MSKRTMSPSAPGLSGIIGFSIHNWRMTLGIMIFAVIGGIYALTRLPLDAEPDIPVPFINVQVVLPGISPEDGERLLIRPLETELKAVEGLKQLDGVASTNVAYVILEFQPSTNLDLAMQDVLEKVDRARAEFPQEAREPVVQEISITELPIVTVNLWGGAPERELQARAKDLQRRIESIPSVLEASISGERTDVLEAILDPAKIESLGITFGEMQQAIANNNALIPAGSLETNSGKFNIKLPGLIAEPKDMSDLVIRRNETGGILRLGDIAEVRRGFKDVQSHARFNGRKSVSLEVSKRQGENILDTTVRVQDLVNEITASEDWPNTVNVSFSQTRSIYIADLAQELFSSIVNAVVLVFIVCIAALGWRSAIFVGWAIPGSFMIAFFLFLAQGETLNFMILFGLILSVGVLVDSAIVIVEYADRKMEEGLARIEAFKLAGERMFWPVISSTATTLAAFLPLLFWETITGKFMSYLPLTMIYVLLASTLMALIFLPTLGAKIGFRPKKNVNSNAALLAGDGDPSKVRGITGGYVKLISFLVKWPLAVLAGMALLAVGIVFFFSASMAGPPPKPVDFFTQSPGDEVYILARARGNLTPDQMLDVAKDIENRIQNVDGIQSVYTTAGGRSGGASFSTLGDIPSDTIVQVYTELQPYAKRRASQEIIDDISELTTGIPGIITEVIFSSQGPPIDKDISIQISSENKVLLRQVTEQVRAKMRSIEGLVDIDDSLPLPGVDFELIIDRAEAGRLGLDVSRIGAALSLITEGTLVGQYRPLDADEEVDIRLRYPSGTRDLAELDSLRIQTPNGSLPLSSVVKRVPVLRQDKIERRDLSPFYVVKGNTAKDYATNIQTQKLQDWLDTEANLPSEVKIKFLGQAEENAEASLFAIWAGLAILFMMSIILLLQFNSFYHVFLTLFAVILSIFGVLLGLAFYSYISMILTLVGVIALAGIVVNNNIVLIDTYQRLLEKDYGAMDAAIRTAAQRLRPVFLTTLTTIVGLMPLVLGWQANIFTGEFSTKGSSTSEIWAPISYVIVCGLGFATILTLIVTPVMLAMPTVMSERFKKLLARSKNRKTTHTDPPAPAPAE